MHAYESRNGNEMERIEVKIIEDQRPIEKADGKTSLLYVMAPWNRTIALYVAS